MIGFTPAVASRLEEPQRAEHGAVIGDRHGGHARGARASVKIVGAPGFDCRAARCGPPRRAASTRSAREGGRSSSLRSVIAVREAPCPETFSTARAVDNYTGVIRERPEPSARGLGGVKVAGRGPRSSARSRSSGSGSSSSMRSPVIGWSNAEPPRVQEGPLEPERRSRRRPRPRTPVAQDRVADRLQVHPDLVGPAGPRRRLEQRGARRAAPGPRTRSRPSRPFTAVDHDPLERAGRAVRRP